ncbi:FHA domain-containing protein [Streptomyces sp. NPDC005955]|uniref:FHA domain-containing protein n=1 Tax=Streptomyces sp. NPDC005955 TaxID=3364738 RepID=UPI0036BCB21A
MPTCPNGHQSGADDWCEVCGHRMTGAVPPPPPPPAAGYGFPPPAPGAPGGPPPRAGSDPVQPEYCPQCHTPREGGAPFCEECRWNFITNKATSYTPPAPRPPGGLGGPPPGRFPGPGGPPGPSGPPGPPGPGGAPGPHGQGPGPHGQHGQGPGPLGRGPGQHGQAPGQHAQAPGPLGQGSGQDAFGYQGSRPSQVNRPAEPIPSFGGGAPGPGGPPSPPPVGQVPGGPPGPGAPAAFQQGGPPAPPAHPGFPDTGRPGPPPPPGGGQGFGGEGHDDWVISPPSGSSGPGGEPLPRTHAGPGGFPASDSWSATIGPDREYFLAMMQRSGPEAVGLNLPAYSPEQHRPLIGNQITIGRRRHSTGEVPDIDLSVPPEDPGVSHQHAVLVQQPSGAWAIVDQNSTNGTTVNGSDEPIQPFVPVPLQDGDRVHVGAWTTITIHRG